MLTEEQRVELILQQNEMFAQMANQVRDNQQLNELEKEDKNEQADEGDKDKAIDDDFEDF